MITGRWGKPSEVLLDIVVEADGSVRGVANPATQNAQIRRGHFDAASGAVNLEGEHVKPHGTAVPFRIAGRLDGRTLRLSYEFGDMRGTIDLVRVEEYAPPPLTLKDRLVPHLAALKRWFSARSRPSREQNARALHERGESLDSITFRDAVAADIPALAELHVTTWNATYNTSRGPTVATRTAQWNQVFGKDNRRDFVLVLEDRNKRLIGFTWGKPNEGEFEGQLSKIYLRWEYHGLGLGRRMMAETARRFLERGIHSFVLFAELSNPTLAFYDRMGGERLLDDRGRFHGAYVWRDARALIGRESMKNAVSAARIAAARAHLAQYFDATPLVRAESLSTPGRSVYLKNETVLPTGSFKVRGAIYALQTALARGPVKEVVAASTGNHGAAVAYAAKLLAIPARIFLPRDANPVKVARVREFGAALVEEGRDLSAAIDGATGHVARTGALFLDDASAPDIPIGTATIGAEILEQLPSVDTVFVPMGDTALIRGVAAALRSSGRPIRIVGVVAEGAPAYYLSWKSGHVVETGSPATIADGLAVRRPLAPNVSAIQQMVDEVVTVSEQEMLEAIRKLRSGEGIVAEPSGAAATAGLLKNEHRGGTCVVIVTGGNISPDVERLSR